MTALPILASCGHSATAGDQAAATSEVGTQAVSASAVAPSTVDPSAPTLECAPLDGGEAQSWPAGGGNIAGVRYPPADTAGSAAAQTAIVVSNQSDQTLCGWTQSVSLLRPYGTVWLYNYTGAQDTGLADLSAVVAKAMDDGAKRVILFGASKGAKASLVAAASLPSDVPVAVVALSPEANLVDGTPVLDKIAGTSFPALIVTAQDDPYQAAPASQAFKTARPDVTHLVVVPGNDHGTALLAGAAADSVTKAVQSFLTEEEH